jgi:formylglycine-generating enzyme required for sulfatase activity/plastocyanin
MGIRLQGLAALALAFQAYGATIRGTVTVPAGLPNAANAVVYIEQISGKTYAGAPAVIDQRNYAYAPHVLPVVIGSTVEFRNEDPDAHNSYSASECCRFNLHAYPGRVKFDKPGVAEILCNIHPQMGAYVLALQNPYFAVTDAAGRFEIRDVPPGNFELHVWHEALPALQRALHVDTGDVEVKLALADWPRPATTNASDDMVLVPAGEFVMGADDRLPNEKPHRTVKLPAFQIDRTEVTNAQFCDFLNALRHSRDEWINLDDPDCKIRVTDKRGVFRIEPGFENFPIVCVSWEGATAYAKWLGKRLPTEVEWEKAARGTDGREWPWGNEFGAGNANARATKLMPVGSFPRGASPFGCLDMAGNVWEWTASDDGDSGEKITRGGAFDSPPLYARCAVRIAAAPTLRSAKTGFRCAKDAD